VAIVLLGAVLFTLAFASRPAAAGMDARALPSDARSPAWPLAGVIAGVGALVAAGLAIGLIPLGGALWTLLSTLALAAVEVAVIVALLRPRRERAPLSSSLALVRPRQGLWALALAPVAGVALYFMGQAALRLIPATGISPVVMVVGWPSGSLAVGLAGVLSPLVEEVFFRGFVYGTIDRRLGRPWAFAVTVILFAAVHLPQSWGAWGGLTAIALTGAGLTALRLWTGSTLAPALAHLTHNGLIALLSYLAGVGALVGK
jgi:membrane protease YdiL (CAAX protease family)